MSSILIWLKAKASATSLLSSNLGQLAVITCMVFALLFSGCSQDSSISAEDNNKLARERARIAAEKQAERDTIIKELLARNVPTETDSEKMWVSFRQAYPYHSQVLALSASSSDGSRTLVISEPPPHVTVGDILFPLGSAIRNHTVKKHEIGYDGWIKDVVIELVGSDTEVDSKLSQLNRLLFHTSYMSYVLPLPAKSLGSASFNLDLQVTSAELKSWVVDAREMFTPVEGGDSISFKELSGQKMSGVFYSAGGGIVGWWIPKGRSIDDCRIQARQFSLDSDLIIGALSDPNGILVLGRERVIPVDLLPPLRVETLSLLAAVQKGQTGELKQSYERNHLFAGPIQDGKDWAPILLSPELRDTEYGSLLNITDQLLKGWSNNGNTSYYNFKYPRPKSWPFKGSLIDRLGTGKLTYNWNTRGAGYTVDAGDYKLLALNRTGALPVTYIPEGSEGASPTVSAAEEEAYNYFARLNDANLVRVVQYAAIYQIFSAFDVARPSSTVASTSLPDQKLKELTNELMSEIRRASPRQIDEMARQLTPLVAAQFGSKQVVQQLLGEAMIQFRQRASDELQALGYVKGTSEYNAAISEILGRERARLQSEISSYIAQEKRQLGSKIKNQLELAAADTESDDKKSQAVRTLALSQLAGLRKLPERYAEAASSRSNGWIHTPAVVISWNSGSLSGASGGHNLDAKVTRFRVSDDVKAGMTRVDGEGNILVNPRDIDRVNKVVRTAGRAEGESGYALSSKLDSALASTPTVPPRVRANALNLPASPPLPPNGPPRAPISTAFPEPGFNGSHWHAGWARPRGQLPESDPLVGLLRQRRSEIEGLVIVERDTGGIFKIAHSEKSRAIEAYTPEDATDVVIQLMRGAPGDAQPLKVELRGFQEHEASGFIKSCEIRASNEKIPREISSVVSQESRVVREESAVVSESGGGGRGSNGGGNKTGGKDPGRNPKGGGDDNGGGGASRRGGDAGGDGGESWLLGWRQRRYDFSKAEVKVLPEVDVLPNGMQSSRILVEVPSMESGALKGQTTIVLGFRGSTPREVVGIATRKVAESIRSFIKGIRNEYEAIKFNLRLNREIKRVGKEMDVDMDLIRHSFGDGRGDLYLAKRKENNGSATPYMAACQSA
jgi:hypothetical protein